MGKLHSKHAAICKPRESPEGDSFVVNACLARKGLDDWLVKQKYYCTGSRLEQQDCHQKSTCRLSSRDPLDEACAEGISDENYRLEVALPPEKFDSCGVEEKMQEKEGAAATGLHKQLQFEDITSLLHTIYEVVDASVNHSPSSSKTLRVKLSVAPDASQRWRNCTQNNTDTPNPRIKGEKCFEEPRSSEKKSRALLRRHHSDHHTQQGCQRHCVDENLERRNHYLDLAGIENYTSRFGTAAPTTEPPKADQHASRSANQTRSRSHEPENGHAYPPSSHHRRSHTISTETAALPNGLCPRPRPLDSVRQTHGIRSPKPHHRTPTAQASSSRVMKRGAPPPPTLPVQAGPHQISGPYRRHKQRPKDTGPSSRALGPAVTTGPVVEKEQVRDLPSVVLYEGGLAQVVQRHEHHHHHEHHYHYHHFYQS
ncbi:protein naked cuticle homolog 1-like isoform X2 [Hoplias malabaricus]|uniref:protein naked cuticle homolog 1-like isoform X2 n=1 Tax=Hoplias malabaricus TaxID=27720 RepID=UPI0034625285